MHADPKEHNINYDVGMFIGVYFLAINIRFLQS